MVDGYVHCKLLVRELCRLCLEARAFEIVPVLKQIDFRTRHLVFESCFHMLHAPYYGHPHRTFA